MSEDTSRARANVPKRLQYRFDAFVAVFDQAFEKSDIITAYVKSAARLAFDLSAPTLVNCQDRAVGANQSDLLDQAINDFLNLLKIETVTGIVLGLRSGCTRSSNVHWPP